MTLNIKALRHYSASQLLAGGIDLRNTAARLGHGDGGATTLRHYADPVSEVDRQAAAYLDELTSLGPTTPSRRGREGRPAYRSRASSSSQAIVNCSISTWARSQGQLMAASLYSAARTTG